MPRDTAEARIARLRLTHDAASREVLLAELLTVDANPVVESALNHRRGMINAGDRDDLKAQVFVRLLRKLNGVTDSIDSFDDYVATVTYHVVDDYVRATNPEGAMIANRIRYLVRHDPRFAAWEHRGETVCGLAAWEGRAPGSGQRFHARTVDARTLLSFFNSIGTPVPLRALTTSRANVPVTEFAVEDRGFARVETRELLDRLRDEIAKLPVTQRIALLLGIRDNVASIDEIARIIEWPPAALAEIWNELPLEDDRIAAMLGLTRQQVINLRKSARARLARRMEQWS